MTATTSPSFWPRLVAVVAAAELVGGTGSEVTGSVVCGAVVAAEVAWLAVVGSSTELDEGGKGLGALPAADVVVDEAGGVEGPAVASPESRVSRMIPVVAPATTSTARIARSTLRVVLLGGGSSGDEPYPGGGPYGGPGGGPYGGPDGGGGY